MPRFGPHSATQIRRLRSRLGRALATVGFWSAVVLGVASLSVLLIAPGRIDVLTLLIVGDVLALVVGHRHDPGGKRRPATWSDRESEVA